MPGAARPNCHTLTLSLGMSGKAPTASITDDELDSEDVSGQRTSASLPDSVPIESEEERAAREARL